MRHVQVGHLRWRKAHERDAHPYRQSSWGGLKRYFVEWRKRALLRREGCQQSPTLGYWFEKTFLP